MKIIRENFEIIDEKHGQDGRYGDYLYRYEVKTDMDEESFIQTMLNDVLKEPDLPSMEEWQKNVGMSGEHYLDFNYYFTGYYEVYKNNDGYLFIKVRPYAD